MNYDIFSNLLSVSQLVGGRYEKESNSCPLILRELCGNVCVCVCMWLEVGEWPRFPFPRRSASFSLTHPLTRIDKSKALSLLLHAADISHPTKQWSVHSRWTKALMEEFFRQVTLSVEPSYPLLCKFPTFYTWMDPMPVKSLSAQLDFGFCYAPLFSGHRGSILFSHCSHSSPQPSQPWGIYPLSPGWQGGRAGPALLSTLWSHFHIGGPVPDRWVWGEEEGRCLGLARPVLSLQPPELLFLLRQGWRAGWSTLTKEKDLSGLSKLFPMGKLFLQVISPGLVICNWVSRLCSLSPLPSSPSETSLLIKHFLQVSLTSLWSQPSLCWLMWQKRVSSPWQMMIPSLKVSPGDCDWGNHVSWLIECRGDTFMRRDTG